MLNVIARRLLVSGGSFGEGAELSTKYSLLPKRNLTKLADHSPVSSWTAPLYHAKIRPAV